MPGVLSTRCGAATRRSGVSGRDDARVHGRRRVHQRQSRRLVLLSQVAGDIVCMTCWVSANVPGSSAPTTLLCTSSWVSGHRTCALSSQSCCLFTRRRPQRGLCHVVAHPASTSQGLGGAVMAFGARSSHGLPEWRCCVARCASWCLHGCAQEAKMQMPA